MPRIGRHPLKGASSTTKPTKELTITTIVFIPSISGYWQESLEIFKLFVESVYQNTNQPFDLMVFDNGSCKEVCDYLLELHNKGVIQYLILSEYNLGKTGALNILLSAAPGTYVTYADSDLYFLPGWIENSLDVFTTFPKAGKVTALPIVMNTSSTMFNSFFSNALRDAEKDSTTTIKTGALVPDVYVDAHRLSLGESEDQYRTRILERKDFLLCKNSCEVLISGADHQFTISRSAINAILPLIAEPDSESGDAIYAPIMERKLANKGYWQLSTSGYFVHHMGNHIPDFGSELPWLAVDAFSKMHEPMTTAKENSMKDRKRTFAYRFYHNRIIRTILKKIHILTYRRLYE